MNSPRTGHTAIALQNGLVLLAGGRNDASDLIGTAELFNPSTGAFTLTSGSLVYPRAGAKAVLLTSGEVLLLGGSALILNPDGSVAEGTITTAEIFNPSNGSFRLTTNPMNVLRLGGSTVTRLLDGRVLIVGGEDALGNPINTAEIYDPSTGILSLVSATTSFPRMNHTATLLSNGQVLICGGHLADYSALSSAELFDPATGKFTLVSATMMSPRGQHSAFLLPDGRVQLAGGFTGINDTTSMEVFDPVAKTFTSNANSMSAARSDFSVCPLQGGDQLFVGGAYDYPDDNSETLLSCTEVYSPSTGTSGEGRLTCTVTNAVQSSAVSGTWNFAVKPLPITPVVSLPSSIIEGRGGYIATTPAQVRCTYTWTITNGTITAGNGTDAVTFTAGTGGAAVALTCTVSNGAGAQKAGSASATVIPSRVVITPGTAAIAQGGQQSLTSNQPVTWKVSAGSLTYTATSATYKAVVNGKNLVDGTYTVTATSQADPSLSATAYITVYVTGSAVINSFTANPTSVHAGQPVTLSWSTSNATNLSLSGGGISQTVTGTSLTLTPSTTTTYTLQAWPSSGGVYAVTTVQVDLIPAITSFNASTSNVSLGGSVQLVPTFVNGTGRIDPGVGPVVSGVPVTVSPIGYSKYTLTVTNPYGASVSSERYIDVSVPGQYSSASNMQLAQWGCRATLLRDGEVLFTGGNVRDANQSWLMSTASNQIFDPLTNAFQFTGPLVNPRGGHTATLCSDGRVLIWGGIQYFGNSTWTYQNTFEVYDPTTKAATSYSISGLYSAALNSIALRTGHTATLLPDGRVLVVGGCTWRDGVSYSNWAGDYVSLGTSLLVELATTTRSYPAFTVTGAMGASRTGHVATRLLDGRVLVAGGQQLVGTPGTSTCQYVPLTSAEIYNPVTGIWSPAGNLSQASHAKNPFLLSDGRVLFDGFEIFDPATLTFSNLSAPYPYFAGFGSKAVLLPNGLIHMESVPCLASGPVLYDLLRTDCYAPTGAAPTSCGIFDGMILLQSGRVLAYGNPAYNSYGGSDGVSTGAVLFDPQPNLGIQPAVGHSNAGLPIVLSASGSDSIGAVWSASGGAVLQDGTFQAQTPGIYAITATSPTGSKATAWIDVHPSILVCIARKTSTNVHSGQTIAFLSTVLNHPNSGVVWSLQEGAAAGTISSDGLYTAGSPGTYHIIATSVVDPNQSSSISVTVMPAISLTVSPSTKSVNPGDTVSFVIQEPSGDNYVQWYSNGVWVNAGATYTYTAPMIPGTYTISGVSGLDPTKSASATITVVPIDSFSITPQNPSVVMMNVQYFQASVTTVLGTKDMTNFMTWNCGGGKFDAYSIGTFTASGTPGTYAVQAVLNGTTITANTTVTVTPITNFFLTPSRYVMAPGETIYINGFTQSAAGVQPLAYYPTWNCSGGSITYSGMYTGPATPGTYTVQATMSGTSLTAIAKIMVVDPSVFNTYGGGVQTYRNGYSLTRLLDGRIFIAGGGNNSAEIYDPSTKQFSSVSSTMIQSRQNHSAVLLPDGKVLIVGGVYDNSQPITAELFDPITQTFAPTTSSPLYRRTNLSMTLLPNGLVLISGADGYSGKSLELYDPKIGQFTPTGFLNYPFSTASGSSRLLSDGRVVFITPGGTTTGPSTAEAFDFKTCVASVLPAMKGNHQQPGLVQALDEKLWVMGGVYIGNLNSLSNEYFDPKANQFTVSSSPQLPYSQSGYGLTELVDGSIYLYPAQVAAGGCFHPSSGTLDPVRDRANANLPKAALLPSGEVFLVGYGSNFTAPNPRGSSLIVYDTASNAVVLPHHITLLAGRSYPFQASGTGLGSGSFTWSIQEGLGSINSQGVFTAPFRPGTYHIVATSVANNSVQAMAVVDVITDVEVTLAPTLVQLTPGAVQKFTSDVVGTTNTGVAWIVTGGVILSDGTYTAPMVEGLYSVTAISLADGTRSATANVQVKAGGGNLPAPVISSFSADTNVVKAGQPVHFSWNVVGAYSLTLIGDGNYKDVSGLSSIAVVPSASTQYQLRAQNPTQMISSQAISVSVSAMPVTIAITPKAVALYTGQAMQFGYALSPTTRVAWSASSGTITPSGLYTAPALPGTYAVTVTSVDDLTKSDSCTVTVVPSSLVLSAPSYSVPVGGTKQLGYSFTGPMDPVLVWMTTGGSVTSTGMYSAPSAPGNYSVTLSCAALNLSATATVIVVPISVSIAPTQVTMVPGQTWQFDWSVNNGGVTASVLEPGGGTITQGGHYTAPSIAGVYTVQVVSQLDATIIAQAKVTVNPIAITIDPPAVTLEVNQSIQFGASLNSGGWTWSTTGGVIDNQGRYRAPLVPGLFTVTVQSVLDPSKTATSQVTVVAASNLKLIPNEITMSCGGTIPMTVVGIPDGASVTWSITNGINGSPGGGAIGPDNVFTAGNIPGSYFITVMESSGGARANAQVQIISHRIIPDPENGLVGLGQQLQFAAEVFDTSPSVTWSISEANGGTIDANGLYTAPLQQGQYHVVVQTSQGNLATIPLLVGPPDGFTVAPEVNIQVAGTYEIKLRLKSLSGKTTESLVSGDYPAGAVNPEITFSQGQLKTDLGEDGPYALDQVMLNQLVDGELLEVDRKYGIGYTGPYLIAEGDKPWISIGDIEQIIAEDSNSNGLIDKLKVQFTVNVICDGTYTIGGGLVSEDGSEVDSAQAEVMLTRGPNVVTIPFDGKRIYSCGKWGSYGIKGLTVTGPVMTTQDFPAAITGFSLDQFEH
jgi:hypothetical protein